MFCQTNTCCQRIFCSWIIFLATIVCQWLFNWSDSPNNAFPRQLAVRPIHPTVQWIESLYNLSDAEISKECKTRINFSLKPFESITKHIWVKIFETTLGFIFRYRINNRISAQTLLQIEIMHFNWGIIWVDVDVVVTLHPNYIQTHISSTIIQRKPEKLAQNFSIFKSYMSDNFVFICLFGRKYWFDEQFCCNCLHTFSTQ